VEVHVFVNMLRTLTINTYDLVYKSTCTSQVFRYCKATGQLLSLELEVIGKKSGLGSRTSCRMSWRAIDKRAQLASLQQSIYFPYNLITHSLVSNLSQPIIKMPAQNKPTIILHDKSYTIPTRPTVVVCIDGFDPEYLDSGLDKGILPTMARWVEKGFHVTAKSAMPSVTNTNNVSIVTGMPPSVHGISGNYYLDKATGEERMVLDDSTMIGSTILERMGNAGVRVAAVTAKDKLRRIIDHGLKPEKGAICFSAQNANECTLAEYGIADVEEWLGRPTPEQYSADLSLFVLDAGIKLLSEKRADLFYLTLSDYVQHKHAPGSPKADEFMQAIDTRLGQLEDLGAKVAVTGDHGMSAKAKTDGEPSVLFLGDFLNEKWPDADVRVICPIADPFVKHHGALGGFVRVHIMNDAFEGVEDMIEACSKIPEVEVACSGKEAASRYEMPEDREGDFIAIAKENAVIGSIKEKHDLSRLGDIKLRSHGGLSEQEIPLIMSEAPADETTDGGKAWRNFDIFDLVLNK
jgi:phosphonoacetate hydrolase